MSVKSKTQAFTLPSTGRKIIVTFQVDEDVIKFVKRFGYDISKYKPSYQSWNDYYLELEHWVKNANIDQVNQANRQDIKLAWVKLKGAQLDSNGNLYMTSSSVGRSHQDGLRYNNPSVAQMFQNINRSGTTTSTSNTESYPGRRAYHTQQVPNNTIIYTQEDANRFIQNGDIENLSRAINSGILPSPEGVREAVIRRDTDILHYLARLSPPYITYS